MLRPWQHCWGSINREQTNRASLQIYQRELLSLPFCSCWSKATALFPRNPLPSFWGKLNCTDTSLWWVDEEPDGVPAPSLLRSPPPCPQHRLPEATLLKRPFQPGRFYDPTPLHPKSCQVLRENGANSSKGSAQTHLVWGPFGRQQDALNGR